VRSTVECLLWIVLAVVTTAASEAYVHAEPLATDTTAGEIPALAELPALCQAAKEGFRPLTAADLADVKKDLVEAVTQLDRRLDKAGKNGEAWRKYLHWDRMQDQLRARGEPDLDVLDEVYKKYTSDHDGLELVWFLDVRRGLQRYRNTARKIDDPKLQAACDQLLDQLAERLQAYAAEPAEEGAIWIGRAAGLLEDVRQAPELIAAIRHHFVHPNLMAQISERLISTGIGMSVDEPTPVRDVILKTKVYGKGRTTGTLSVELAEHTQFAVIDTVMRATTETENVGYRGPATIFTEGTTRMAARKRLWITDKGLSSYPAVSNAVTNTRFTGVRTKRDSKLMEKIVWKKAYQQKAEAERVASLHARQRLNGRVNEEAAEMLGIANKTFVEKFRRPLIERKLFPARLEFSTTDDTLRVLVLQAGAGQLAAFKSPPEPAQEADAAVQVHQSMINNIAASALAGVTLTDEDFQEAVISLLGELPERLQAEDQEAWAITFDSLRPISVKFADDGFEVTIRGRKFYKSEESYPGMDVTAAYKIEKTDAGYKAVRDGELKIFPPRFAAGKGTGLSAREVVIRQLLERRFSRIFREELVGEGLTLPGKWAKAGKMMPIQLQCKDGWLAVAWRGVPQEKDPEPEDVAATDR